MAFDIKKLGGGKPPGGGNIIDPRKIFGTLARNPRFRRPSDEQGEVLDKWFAVRAQADNTLKMNTGAGKTLVGLLALQSSLNEEVGPAAYVTPDIYLARQVIKEATELGIAVTDDPRSAAYMSGKAILVINIYKFINGRSVFGVGSEGSKIPIGSLVVDDAHACLAVVAAQFTISLSSKHAAYGELLKLLEEDLRSQSETGLLDIQSGDPQTAMLVPFWAWKDKHSQITKILHTHRDSEALLFVWPLLKEVIPLCQCAIGGRGLEIAPRCLPIDEIPSFVSAKRRIYMTATLADDGILISHFQADPKSVTTPIKPNGVGEIGDRMILAPQEINPKILVDEIKGLAAEIAKQYNVVVIVPSKKRSSYWSDVAAQTLDATNIEDGIAELKNGKHIGITVLINKYDGVDLPGDACRLLVIDGLPEVFGLIERNEMAALDGTDIQLVRQMQRLEQGMGRGVRSGEDHCAVLLVGSRLTQRIHLHAARSKLTAATLVQLDLSREVAEQIAGQPIAAFRPVLDYCIKKNPDWWRTGRERLANAAEGPVSFVDPNVAAIRSAFDLARGQLLDKACAALQAPINSTGERRLRGYLKQQLAEYEHHQDPGKAQETQLSAYQDNRRTLRPIKGITYNKLSPPAAEQALTAAQFMKARFLDGNDLILFANALADDLDWYEDDAKRFEAAMRELGRLLGFGSQRPELEVGKGPDNLWAVGGLRFFVIEDKNGATSDIIAKSDCNQLLGSMEWFNQAYDKSCIAIPIMVHPETKFDQYSSPSADFRMLDKVGLKKLREAIKAYATSVAASNGLSDPAKIRDRLAQFGLSGAKFVETFTRGFTKAK